MGKSYTITYEIPFYETDVNQCAKLPQLLSVALQASGLQSFELGVSDQYVLDTYNLIWVITDYHMDIKRLPKFNEKVIIETEAKSHNKIFCYRDFHIRDQSGNELITILSTFVLMDFDTRKVSTVPQELADVYESQKTKKMRRGPRYSTIENAQNNTYHVRYFDLDMNCHVNNCKYLEWIYDVMPIEFLKTYYPKCIDLKYNKEIQYGHDINSQVEMHENNVSHHQIVSDDQINAQSIIEWTPFDK